MTKNKTQFIFFALFLMIGLVLPPFSGARDITYNPRLFLNGEYSDNIQFSTTDKEDDFIYNIAPAMELNYSSELLDLNSLALVRFIRYHSEDDLDREDYSLNLNSTYRMTERLKFFGRLNYVQDYTFQSRNIELLNIGTDPIEDPDTIERGIENNLSERKSYNAFASLNYRLTELSNLNFGYRYIKTDYDIEENTDFDVNHVSMTYLRDLEGQKDQIGTRLNYTKRSSDVSDTDSYGTGLIWNHIFTETISLYTDIGVRYTEQNFKDSDQKNDDWGATAKISLRRLGETHIMNIGFQQDILTASDGGAVNVSKLYWNIRQSLSERFFLGLGGDSYITREDGDSFSDIDTVFFNIYPSLIYALTENHSVRLAYSYTIKHDRSLETDRDTERNRVWISFEFGFPQK